MYHLPVQKGIRSIICNCSHVLGDVWCAHSILNRGHVLRIHRKLSVQISFLQEKEKLEENVGWLDRGVFRQYPEIFGTLLMYIHTYTHSCTQMHTQSRTSFCSYFQPVNIKQQFTNMNGHTILGHHAFPSIITTSLKHKCWSVCFRHS